MCLNPSSNTGTISVSKTLKPEDLFDNYVAEDAVPAKEIDKGTVDEILRALGVRPKVTTLVERQDAFFNSLPPEAQEAIQSLMRLVGVTTTNELFYSSTPRDVYKMIQGLNKLDLERLYAAFNNA